MTQEGFKRKLTTIFSADAVGYSRLMGDDEAATVKTIELYRKIISEKWRQAAKGPDTDKFAAALLNAGLKSKKTK